jgi:hypothetical protein
MEKIFFAAGGPQPEIAADGALKKKALGIIQDNVGMHFALVVPLLWRGATLAFPILLVALGYAAYCRRYDLLAFGLPALGTTMMYALLTHFIGRYNLPSLAIATVVLLVSIGTFRDGRQPGSLRGNLAAAA